VPKIIGGQSAITPVEGKGMEKVRDAIRLKYIKSQMIGEDILVIAEPLVYKRV